ncbi:eukaryotic translation initiation factor 3 subunit C isoform X3 [Hydra vulgaris]|uniref:Eukaryotic translation initiation factor 3 subunit C n=1 Tax=Hydra vulgaris TaxID=6087 RepID=A0ABM4CN88_HYDVU
MSRFFRAGSSESESEESEEEEIQRPKANVPTRSYQFSDDEEDAKRVVRSAKDKKFEVLQVSLKSIRNSMKINDVVKIQTEYENLTKGYEKSKTIIQKEGIPNFFIKGLADLEDFIQQQWEDAEGRKKLSKLNAKALASLRQKVKKFNREFEEKIVDYKKDPSKYEEVEEEEENEEDADQESDFEEVKPKNKVESAKPPRDDDDDSDDFFGTDSDESSSDDELPEGGRRQWGAWMFLKDASSKDDKKKEKRIKKERPKETKTVQDDGWTEVSKTSEKMRMLFPKDTEINHHVILKKFHEILAVRGKKGTDRSEQVDYFVQLKNISEQHNLGPALCLKLLFNIASAIVDSSMGTDIALKTDMWNRLLDTAKEIYSLIAANPNILFNQSEYENIEDKTQQYQLLEDPITLLERLDNEFTKILQNCDGHSTEYIQKLKDELEIVSLIDQVIQHHEKHPSSPETLSRLYLLRIEHTYFKVDLKQLKEIQSQIKLVEVKRLNEEQGVASEKVESIKVDGPTTVEDSKDDHDSSLMSRMCKYIYSNGSDRIRTRAMLCHIFHHAKHNRWFEARDLMLISHLQENIHHSDIPTQILYNRTMVQLGLCSFRHGMIKDAHNALQDIQSTGRAKEMLAQGLMNLKNTERTPEQEKIEKRRMMPFHMHVNLELIECVFLTSAMLLEIPNMAANEYVYKRRPISKSFQNQLRHSEKQALVGPPESMREHIVAASKAMKVGDWKKCRDNILAVSCWELFPNSDAVKSMITRKIQEESLRTYLFTYNKVYDSISMHSLAQMFDLPSSVVHSTISKMIISEELQASWDEPTETLVLHHGAEPTYLQSLTLQLSDKLNTLVEHHERILDFKYGPIFNKDVRKPDSRKPRNDSKLSSAQPYASEMYPRKVAQKSF